MAHNLQEMMKDKTSAEKVGLTYNADNASDVALVIKEINLHIEDMEKLQVEFERKIIDTNKEYRTKIAQSMDRLKKLINS